MKQQSGQLAFRLAGGGLLREPVGLSSLDLCVRLKPDSGYLTQYPALRAMVQIADSQFKRDAEGFLHFPIYGSLGHPEVGRSLCKAGALP